MCVPSTMLCSFLRSNRDGRKQAQATVAMRIRRANYCPYPGSIAQRFLHHSLVSPICDIILHTRPKFQVNPALPVAQHFADNDAYGKKVECQCDKGRGRGRFHIDKTRHTHKEPLTTITPRYNDFYYSTIALCCGSNNRNSARRCFFSYRS